MAIAPYLLIFSCILFFKTDSKSVWSRLLFLSALSLLSWSGKVPLVTTSLPWQWVALFGVGYIVTALPEPNRGRNATSFILNLSKRPRWGNLGLWSAQTKSYAEACEAHARAVADLAELKPSDRVLDVGCGSGEQDLFFRKSFGVKHITAIDQSPSEIEFAKSTSASIGEIQYLVGDASKLTAALVPSTENGNFDKIVCVDSAYHFGTRREFFRQASSVLKSGGKIGLSDIVLPTGGLEKMGVTKRIATLIFAKLCGIPRENLYDAQNYAWVLQDCGFKNVNIRHADEEVFDGFCKFVKKHRSDFSGYLPTSAWNKIIGTCWVLKVVRKWKLLRFVFVGAEKSSDDK